MQDKAIKKNCLT